MTTMNPNIKPRIFYKQKETEMSLFVNSQASVQKFAISTVIQPICTKV